MPLPSRGQLPYLSIRVSVINAQILLVIAWLMWQYNVVQQWETMEQWNFWSKLQNKTSDNALDKLFSSFSSWVNPLLDDKSGYDVRFKSREKGKKLFDTIKAIILLDFYGILNNLHHLVAVKNLVIPIINHDQIILLGKYRYPVLSYNILHKFSFLSAYVIQKHLYPVLSKRFTSGRWKLYEKNGYLSCCMTKPDICGCRLRYYYRRVLVEGHVAVMCCSVMRKM